MDILGHGVYNLSEAARLTRLKPQRVREWLTGGASGPTHRPVFRSDHPPVGGDRAISFHDLIELFVAGWLRERGVSLRMLRMVHQKLQEELRTKHSFCRRELLTQSRSLHDRSGRTGRGEDD